MRTPALRCIAVFLLIGASSEALIGQNTSINSTWVPRPDNVGGVNTVPPANTLDPYQTSPQPTPSFSVNETFRGPTLQPMPIVMESAVLQWKLLPKDNIYPFYLADRKASRMSGIVTQPKGDHLLLDTTLGGRFGLFRLGDSLRTPFRRGMQLDFEGSAQLRLDMEEDVDVRSVDFRAGLPLSFAFGRWHTRIGYYHLSSHVGDEFLLKNKTFKRLNFSRDVLFAGAAYWITERLRIYGEIGWAFYTDVSKEWEFNTGIEYLPTSPTGWRGTPFWAIHLRSREELDYGGSVNAQIGWSWRASDSDRLLRLGINYFEGKSPQWSFFDIHEPSFGIGLWYDY